MDANQSQLKLNFTKLYGYSFFQSFLVVIPVIVPYWKGMGISVKEIFTLQALFAGVLILFDLPAGYLADILGRKRTMIAGSIVSALAFQIFWFGNSFFDFAIYEVILGIGLSLQSGCDVAILYGTAESLKMTGRKSAFLGKRITSMTIGEGVASLLGGLLAGFSLTLPAQVNAITAWIPVLFACSLTEPPFLKMNHGSHWKNLLQILRAVFGHSRLLTLALISFIIYGFATYCAVWSLQPYWASRNVSIQYFGYLWAANSFLIAVVGRYAHHFEEKFGSTLAVIIIGLMPIIGYLGMAIFPGYWGLLFILTIPICRGLNQVIFQDAINSRVPSNIRAIVNSFGSLGMRALFLIFGPLIGASLDQGPSHVMMNLGVLYVFGFLLVILPLLNERKHYQLN